jgi:hypothetical protein
MTATLRKAHLDGSLPPGQLGLYALFGGVLSYAAVGLGKSAGSKA